MVIYSYLQLFRNLSVQIQPNNALPFFERGRIDLLKINSMGFQCVKEILKSVLGFNYLIKRSSKWKV
jgi:hypothetical protein